MKNADFFSISPVWGRSVTIFGGIVVATGLATLAGSGAGPEALQDFVPGPARMLPLAAAGLVVAGIVLLLLNRRRESVEGALRTAREELERRVRERTADLTEERELLNVVLCNAWAHIVVCDTAARLVLDNRAGNPREGLVIPPVPPEKWSGYFGYCDAEDKQPLEAAALPLHRALGGVTVRCEELLLPDEVGGFRTVVATAQPISDQRGTPLGAVMFVHDVTEKKRIEAQLHRSQRLESIGTLAGGIAHDLNNVLVPVMMGIQTLQEEATDEESLKILETVESSTRRGICIVRQILSFARGSAGERVEVALDAVIREHVEMIEETFPPSVAIEKNVDEKLLPVRGDATQLHQVLMNLCLNARDAMPDGGVIRIEGRNLTVGEDDRDRYGGVQPGSFVELIVSDTGEGIPEASLERIFDPFFTTKEPGKGTGLGLSTMVGIVRGHGGFWQVESEPGKGTEFRILLPALLESSVEPPRKTRRPRVRGQRERVLLVDDDAAVLLVTCGMLERYGYQVLTGRNGLEAVEIFRENPSGIDLVIIDMSMPVMDGATAIRKLRELNAGVPIIAVSGLPDNKADADEASAGTAYFLLKPYTIGVVLETVGRAIVTARGNDESDLLGQGSAGRV